MDPLILAEKLESLRRCVARVEQTRVETVEALASDVDRQDFISLNLTRVVQLCVDMAMHVLTGTDAPLPQSMGEAFDVLAARGSRLAGSFPLTCGTECVERSVSEILPSTVTRPSIGPSFIRSRTKGVRDFRRFAQALAALLPDAQRGC